MTAGALKGGFGNVYGAGDTRHGPATGVQRCHWRAEMQLFVNLFLEGAPFLVDLVVWRPVRFGALRSYLHRAA